MNYDMVDFVAAATKGWLSTRDTSSFITHSSLKLAVFCTGFADTLSVIKIIVALSYRHAIIHYLAGPQMVKNFGMQEAVGTYTVPSVQGSCYSSLVVNINASNYRRPTAQRSESLMD